MPLLGWGEVELVAGALGGEGVPDLAGPGVLGVPPVAGEVPGAVGRDEVMVVVIKVELDGAILVGANLGGLGWTIALEGAVGVWGGGEGEMGFFEKGGELEAVWTVGGLGAGAAEAVWTE